MTKLNFSPFFFSYGLLVMSSVVELKGFHISARLDSDINMLHESTIHIHKRNFLFQPKT